MKKVIITIVILLLLAPLYATPDRGVWVIDTLIGFTDKSFIIKQYVYDNMRSHYQSRIQVYLIEKDIKKNSTIKNIKITEYIESVDSNTGEVTRNNRSEDKITEIIQENPELFYSIYYVFPIGLPNGHKERSYLVNGEIVISDGNDNILKYPLTDYIKIDVPPKRIIQEYETIGNRILLIEFGEPTYEGNYYQKIVVIEKKI